MQAMLNGRRQLPQTMACFYFNPEDDYLLGQLAESFG